MSTGVPTRLDGLDDALATVRRLWERPEEKRRFLAELGEPVELAALRTLRAVERAGKDPGVSQVADVLTVDVSTASRLVDQSIAAGYVTRHSGHPDRRRSQLRLTARGRRLMARARQFRRARLAELTADWPPEDVETLTRLLERLGQGVQAGDRSEG